MRVTRKTHHRGQHVRVTFRDSRTPVVGTVDEWGAQYVSVRPDHDHDGEYTWKRHSFHVTTVAQVTEVRECGVCPTSAPGAVDWGCTCAMTQDEKDQAARDFARIHD